MKYFLILLLTVYSASCFSKPKVYNDINEDDELILVVDDQSYMPEGMAGFTVHYPAFSSNPAAHRLAKKSYDDAVLGQYYFWGLGIGGTLGILVVGSALDIDSIAVPILALGAYFGGVITSGSYFSSANRNFLRAVNHYNGVYDSTKTTSRRLPKQNRKTWDLSLSPTSVGGGLLTYSLKI